MDFDFTLPEYDDEHINSLRVLREQSGYLGDLYTHHERAIDNLIKCRDLYLEKPNVKSVKISFYVAVLNYEMTYASIKEAKDSFMSDKLIDWLP